MKKLLFVCLNLIIIALPAVSPLYAGGPPPQPPAPPPFVPGEILVKFQPHVGIVGAQGSLRAEGLQTVEASLRSGLLRVRVNPGQEREAIANLLARGDVAYATPNYYVYATDTPNDPSFWRQWGLHNSGASGADIDAPEAWNLHTGAGNVTIAIVDTGVDLDHPDLQANIVAGWNFVNNDNLPDDDHGHGTHVAGIAAAQGNNGLGVAGVSWGAKIMPLKALNEWGSGTLANVANAIYYAADNGARVINLSLGAPGSAYPCPGFEAVGEAMQYALSRGSLVVAAAGNEYAAAVSCPAALDQAMAVGSTTSTDARSSFSNYGAQLDIAAPGSSIYSTLWIKDFGATYGYKSGTSMATPHVAGLAALVWSFAPTLTNGQVRDLIQSTAADRGPAGWDVEFGYGRINAAAALGMRAQRSTGLYLPLAIAGSATANTTVTVQTISPTPITWAAAISPPVGWLSLSGSSSGTVSASSPAVITLRGSSLPSYPETSTNLVITGVTAAGKPAPTVTVVINRTSTQVFLPLIMK